MSRFFAFAVTSLLCCAALGASVVVGCSASELDPEPGTQVQDASIRIDGGAVEVPESGTSVDAGSAIAASCEKYCRLMSANCPGKYEQYASELECLRFCAHFPTTTETRTDEDHSLACRQARADSPALTDPQKYCLQAGPFGDNVCGDRCNVFCSLTLSICSPDGGVPAYADQPSCANDCAGTQFREEGADGGGQGPSGPESGDTLNCRLYQLRRAALDPSKCELLRPDAGPCR